MSTYTDYYNQYNQQRGYHSNAGIEDGKTVRYVKLVFDDSDFERFADIFVEKLMSVIGTYENKPAVVEKAADEEVSIADSASDIPKEEPEIKPESEEPKKEWRSYLDAHDADKITISTCLDCWASFYSVTNARIAKYLGVSEGSISHWRTGRHFPRTSHSYGLKKLMKLTDEEYDSIMANTDKAARKQRNNKKE